MKYVSTLILFVIGFQCQNIAQPYPIGDDVKRIVFIGNSITYGGTYIEYIDAYMSIHYHERQYEIINVGLPSETVSGLSEENHANGAFPRPDLHERLERILDQTKPDLVFSCYGMNDGIYLPLDEGRFARYKSGINWLHNEIVNSGSGIIHLTPPVYDERKGEVYAHVLDVYSDWLMSMRKTSDWNVIDIHYPMKRELEKQRLIDSSFVFAKDGVHPNQAGHFCIAKQILLGLGETGIEDAGDIKSLLSGHQNAERILSEVGEQQRVMKDAWLTSIGHQRPRMKMGLPLERAQRISDQIDEGIREILSKR